jgi:uncharacterized protein YicC (UPF0701 family)
LVCPKAGLKRLRRGFTAILKDQPSGKRLEFAVRAVNRASQSIESNAVAITL